MCNHEMATIVHIREVQVCKHCQDVDSVGGIGRLEQYIQRWLESQNGLFVQFSSEELGKLQRLAKRRGITVQKVLCGYAANLVPDGGGWVHPEQRKKKCYT